MLTERNVIKSVELWLSVLQVYEFAVKEVLIHRVPVQDGGISPQKKKRKHRQARRSFPQLYLADFYSPFNQSL